MIGVDFSLKNYDGFLQILQYDFWFTILYNEFGKIKDLVVDNDKTLSHQIGLKSKSNIIQYHICPKVFNLRKIRYLWALGTKCDLVVKDSNINAYNTNGDIYEKIKLIVFEHSEVLAENYEKPSHGLNLHHHHINEFRSTQKTPWILKVH